MGAITALSAFILGPFGIGLIALGVAGSFIGASIHMLPPRSGIVSLGCGMAAFIGAYIVRTYVASGLA